MRPVCGVDGQDAITTIGTSTTEYGGCRCPLLMLEDKAVSCVRFRAYDRWSSQVRRDPYLEITVHPQIA